MDISLPDAESTVEFGRQLGRALNEQYAEGGEQVHIILFYGDLGSGKTTFTRGFIEALPGGENAEVSSPSFTLCNSYPTTPSVIHCDLYRSEGALPDEVDEALDTESGLVLVEWAERIAAENLPPKRLDILFQVCKNNRLVTLSPYGKAAHCVLQKLARLRMTAKRKGFCRTGHDEGRSYAYSGTKIRRDVRSRHRPPKNGAW